MTRYVIEYLTKIKMYIENYYHQLCVKKNYNSKSLKKLLLLNETQPSYPPPCRARKLNFISVSPYQHVECGHKMFCWCNDVVCRYTMKTSKIVRFSA